MATKEQRDAKKIERLTAENEDLVEELRIGAKRRAQLFDEVRHLEARCSEIYETAMTFAAEHARTRLSSALPTLGAAVTNITNTGSAEFGREPRRSH